MSISMKTKSAAFAIAASFLAFASPAAAAVFTYNQTNGDVLTINTTTGSGTLIGRSINASFTSPALTSFTGGAAPTGMFNLTDLSGYRTINGRRYTDNTTHQQKLIFGADGSVNLWSYWGRGTQFGDYVTTVGGYTPPPSSSSSTGGTTSGGTTSGGTTSGGTTSGGTTSGGTTSGGTTSGGTTSGGTTSGGTTSGGTTSGGTTSGGTPVPEPEMLALFAVGVAGIGFARRRRRSAK